MAKTYLWCQKLGCGFIVLVGEGRGDMKQAATVMVMFSSSVRFVAIHQAEYLRFVYLSDVHIILQKFF